MRRSRGITSLAIGVLVAFVGSLTYHVDAAAAAVVAPGTAPRASVPRTGAVAPPDLERGVGRTDAAVPGAMGPSQDVLAQPQLAQEVPAPSEPVVPSNPEEVLRSPYLIDNRIVRSKTEPGVLENASNSWIVQFRPMDEGGVRILALTGDSIRVSAAEGAHAVPAIDPSGTSVTYPEVWPSVDLQYEVTDWAVEQRIIVNAPGARSDFPLIVEGGELQAQPDGTYQLVRSPEQIEAPEGGSAFSLSAATLSAGGAAPVPVAVSVLPVEESGGSAPAPPESGGVAAAGGAGLPGQGSEAAVVTAATGDISGMTVSEGDTLTISSSLLVSEAVSPVSGKKGFDDTSGIVGGVNLATGNYTAEALDLSVPAVGPPLEVRRFYNSQLDYVDACLCSIETSEVTSQV